jgi:hypothetical protein
MIPNPNPKRPSWRPRIQPVSQVPSGQSGRVEIVRHFEERRSRREIVKTTHTPRRPYGAPPGECARLVAGTEPRTHLTLHAE